jgi:hypothetical protein
VETEDVFHDGTECGNALAACAADAECLAWLQCSDGCFDAPSPSACVTACTQAHPTVAPEILPLYNCVCDACAMECAGFCG